MLFSRLIVCLKLHIYVKKIRVSRKLRNDYVKISISLLLLYTKKDLIMKGLGDFMHFILSAHKINQFFYYYCVYVRKQIICHYLLPLHINYIKIHHVSKPKKLLIYTDIWVNIAAHKTVTMEQRTRSNDFVK